MRNALAENHAIHNHGQLGLPVKDRAMEGLVVCRTFEQRFYKRYTKIIT